MKISSKSLAIFSFTLLSIIIFANLNGVFWGLMGIRAPLSPIIMLLVIFIIGFAYSQNYEQRHSALIYLFFVFFGFYLIAGTIMSGFYPEYLNPRTSILRGWRTYVPTILVVLAFYKMTTYSADIGFTKKFMNILLITFGCSTFLVVISPYFGFTVDIYANLKSSVETSTRAMGFFANPNDASLVACYTLAIALYCTMIFRRGRLLIFAVAGMAMYANFTTFSKAGLIMMLLILSFYLGMYLYRFWKIRNFQRRTFMVATLAIFIGVGMIAQQWSTILGGLNTNQLDRILDTRSILGGEVTEENSTERRELWDLGMEIIKTNPVTGFGIQTFHRFNPPFELASPALKNKGVHNTFLMLIGEAGAIALLLFLFWNIGVIYQALFLKDPSLMFLIISITLIFLVQHAGASHNALSTRLSPALIAVCMGLIQIGKKYPYRLMINKGEVIRRK